MKEKEYTYRPGHPIVGIILALLGIVIALLTPFFVGVIGGGLAALLGIIAILLGIGARKGGRGLGAIILGVLAVILAIALTAFNVNLFKEMQKQAKEAGTAPLVEQYCENPYFGLFGVLSKIPSDEADAKEFMDQLNSLTKE